VRPPNRRAPSVALARLRDVLEARRGADVLPEAVDALARAIRAGAPPTAAVRAAAAGAPRTVADGFAAIASAVDRGLPLTDALDGWAREDGPPGADLVATAVAVTARAGGDPGRALAAVADTLRERRALRREVLALSSQARLSAAVIAVAPVAFAAVAGVADDSTGRVLLGSPLGLACLAAGLALDAAGWWWMDRITKAIR
jgi:tight adherence protein B